MSKINKLTILFFILLGGCSRVNSEYVKTCIFDKETEIKDCNFKLQPPTPKTAL